MSGPLLDRIDLVVDVPAVDADALALTFVRPRTPVRDAGDVAVVEREVAVMLASEPSCVVRARVAGARDRQRARQGKCNARLLPGEIGAHCAPDRAGKALLAQAMAKLALSARAYHRVLKVARTIADLAGSTTVASAHVAEAIGYRHSGRI